MKDVTCGVCGRSINGERVNGICRECFDKITRGVAEVPVKSKKQGENKERH